MKILIVEDDRKLSEQLAKGLEAAGISSELCYDAESGLYALLEGSYDAAVIDRLLPGGDGAELLRRARKGGVITPAILATALGQVEDRVDGLDFGADDYIVKPYDIRELAARLRALVRRPRQIETPSLSFGGVTLERTELLLRGEMGQRQLSPTEAELLEAFLMKPDATLSRDYLFSRVWGSASETMEGALDIYIHYVRRHLDAVSKTVAIVTRRGLGYRMELKGHD